MIKVKTGHKVGTRDEWLAAREALLEREKQHTRLGDDLARERREHPWLAPLLASGEAPPIIEHNARAVGTDPVSYLAEGVGFTSYVRDGGVVYHTYSTTARGLEFLMGYYPILDRAPNGRDEGPAFQTWLRRHDEYNSTYN